MQQVVSLRRDGLVLREHPVVLHMEFVILPPRVLPEPVPQTHPAEEMRLMFAQVLQLVRNILTPAAEHPQLAQMDRISQLLLAIAAVPAVQPLNQRLLQHLHPFHVQA